MSRARDFWSRRRDAVDAEARAEQALLDDQVLAEQHAELEARTDEEILHELDLPDPETLMQGDDFSVFLKKAVPDRIRRRALRRLWVSNPVLANLDELIDYGEDYTDAATVIENMQTAYQVGKGMQKHVEEMAREARAALEGEPESHDQPNEDDAALAMTDVPQDDVPSQPEIEIETPEVETETEVATSEPIPEHDTPEVAITPRRRMRFDYAV